MSQDVLTIENIILDAAFADKWEAIQAAGEMLVKNEYVEQAYIEDMILREKSVSVYIGNHVAIPHGLVTSEAKIKKSGISFIQIPNGVAFDDEVAYMCIGIAGKDGTHMDILGKIAVACSEMENVQTMRHTTDKQTIIDILMNG